MVICQPLSALVEPVSAEWISSVKTSSTSGRWGWRGGLGFSGFAISPHFHRPDTTE